VAKHPKDHGFLVGLRHAVDRLVEPGKRVVVAVSGGPDSVALLVGWARFAAERGDALTVAHFDHALHHASTDHARFVAALADQLALPCRCARRELPFDQTRGVSLEEAARCARYSFLTRTAHAIGAEYVATAHTADDQAETTLFAIIRGTGLHGVAGMPYARKLADGVSLVRPLLDIPRAHGLAFLSDIGQSSCADPTNASNDFTRNRIRNTLLPLLREKFNPRADEALLRLGRIARSATRFLVYAANELLERALIFSQPDKVELIGAELAQSDPYLAAEAIRLVLLRKNWPRRRIGSTQLARVVELLRSGQPTALDLPDGVRLELIAGPRGVLRLSCNQTARPTCPQTTRGIESA
jgi:tRNA(Ile)-lysidine synthase